VRERDHVLRLVAIEPDRLDQLAYLVLAEGEHLVRRVGEREQPLRRLVDAGVGRLRREHDGDQQREGVDIVELALRLGPGLTKTAEDLADLGGAARFRSRDPLAQLRAGFRAVRRGHRGVIICG
jgi:hypothetical protein